MSGMSGASMLRTRRKDVNVKPNRKLDRKSSRGMLYENEELRLRTININAEVERGQSDIKKLKRENDQLKREISALRYEYDRLDSLLRERKSSPEHSDDSMSVCSPCPDCVADTNSARAHVAFNDLCVVPEEEIPENGKSPTERPCSCEECAPEKYPSTSKTADSAPKKPTPLEQKHDRTVDVLIHDAPEPKFFEAISAPAYHVTDPPPPGSAPVGENEEPIYATVNKLPKRLRRMELANLEQEVAYPAGETDTSSRTEVTPKTDTDHSQIRIPDDDTSRSEKDKPVITLRPDSPKAKKRKRFSFTFKKRERKRRDKNDGMKNGSAKNGQANVHIESDNERLLEATEESGKPRLCSRHRPRNTVSSCSSGPRYKRDSYQEMTTSHSEHERTNSVSSSVNSLGSTFTHKTRKFSAPPQDGNIPWCGCWGAGCV